MLKHLRWSLGVCQYCVSVCFTCAASVPVYECVVLAYCSPPAVEHTGPPGAPWETKTDAEDLLKRHREPKTFFECYIDFTLKFFQIVFVQ